MKIEVTQEHIKKGKPHSGILCPVALAMKDADCQYPSVTYKKCWWVGHDSMYYRSDLPKEATTFVENFDDGHSVGPFSFEIEGEVLPITYP